MKKILITGANGLLGSNLIKLYANTQNQIIATGKGDCRIIDLPKNISYFSLDLTNAVAVNEFIIQNEPNIIIHAAAMTHVDECELQPIKCWDNNVTATRYILDAAKEINAHIIFISTDFIFDGLKALLTEDDYAEPVNYYGSSKLAAEKAVIHSKLNYAIVRTCLVFGPAIDGRSNIILWVKNNLEQNKKIKVINDQWRTPTDVRDLAKAVLNIAEKENIGIYNISTDELKTPYDLAIMTADFFNLNKDLIELANSTTFTQPAQRPAKTGFNILKAKKELGFIPTTLNESLKTLF